MQDFGMQFHLVHQHGAGDVKWSPTGEVIATFETRGTIKLWSAYTGEMENSFTGSSTPRQIGWSPDGSKIAGLYDYGDEVKVYEIGTNQEYIQPENIQERNSGFFWVGENVLLYNNRQRIQIWNVQSNETEMLIDPEFSNPDLIALSPDGKTLASVNYGGEVLIVDLESEKILHTIQTGLKRGITDVVWSSDNRMLAIASLFENKVIVINASSGMISNTLEDDLLGRYLSWAQHDNELITSSGQGTILIWDIESGEILHAIKITETGILDLEMSHDGKLLAAIGGWGEIYMLNTSDWSIEVILQGLNEYLNSANLSFSPDGNKLASLSIVNEIYYLRESHYEIWDLNTQELIYEWNYYELASSIAYSPDGSYLASSACTIWDSLTWEVVFNEECNGSGVLWTPDNKFVVFVDNLVDFWGIRP